MALRWFTGPPPPDRIRPGTTNIALIAARARQSLYPPLLLAGAAMMLVGFGFKIATAPFHVWTPDVYEGAPTPVTAFMAAGPKAAGFASFMRVFVFGFPIATAVVKRRVATLTRAWLGALAIMAILTMTVGNVVAIVQNNVKRMLAYSSIAHAGYALVGFVAAGAATTTRNAQKHGAGGSGLLSADLCGDEHGRVCRRHFDRAARRSPDQR